MADNLKAELRKLAWSFGSDAADYIEKLEAENAALSAWQCVFTDGRTGIVCDEYGHQFCQQARALTQSRAGTAVVIEMAAVVAEEERASQDMGYDTSVGGYIECRASARIRDAIRALATPDQIAALDAVKAEARAQGMREAAIIAHDKSYMDAHNAILAAIKGAKA